jgi:hypothetical protein
MLSQMTVVAARVAQSFRIPPGRYHVKQRIENANTMLAARKTVTQIGVTLACSGTRSFEETFGRALDTQRVRIKEASVERVDFRDAPAGDKHSRPNSRRDLK